MRLFLILSLAGLIRLNLAAQTCCSGGVPISGNVGFSSAQKGTAQFEISFDHNLLNSLYSDNEELADDSRLRITNSYLFKMGYSITDKLAVDALLSYVTQARSIEFFETVNTDKTRGIGDAVVIAKYVFLNSEKQGIDLQIAIGPKIPTGAHQLKNPIGISYNADMQPGSGSWDMISWLRLSKPFNIRPTANFSSSATLRFNGKNNQYLGSQTYQFGNSFQAYLGIADRYTLGSILIEPSFSLRFRHAMKDRINEESIVNTGGSWIYISPSFGIIPVPSIMLFAVGEIPVYSKLGGTQLTTTYRFKAGIFYVLRKKSNSNLNFKAL